MNFHKETNSMFRTFGIVAVLMVVLNLAFWGGLIYFAFWTAKHFGLIG